MKIEQGRETHSFRISRRALLVKFPETVLWGFAAGQAANALIVTYESKRNDKKIESKNNEIVRAQPKITWDLAGYPKPTETPVPPSLNLQSTKDDLSKLRVKKEELYEQHKEITFNMVNWAASASMWDMFRRYFDSRKSTLQ